MTKVVESRSEVTFILCLFVLLTILGVLASGFLVRDYARARASHLWPTADGVVLSRMPGEEETLRYAYSFDGRAYESHRERTFLAMFLQAPSHEYKPGDHIEVYVDPARPSYSLLMPGGAGLAFVGLSLLSGLVIFIGVGGVVWTFSEGVREIVENDVDRRAGILGGRSV